MLCGNMVVQVLCVEKTHLTLSAFVQRWSMVWWIPQYIVPTLMYGIHEMGINPKGFRKTMSTINVHFRRMVRSPVHLMYETVQAFFQRLYQTPPWILLQSHNYRLLQVLAAKRQQAVDQAMADADAPDVIVHAPAYPTSQLEGLPDSMSSSAQDPILTCPVCQRQFNQAGFLKRHMHMMHQIPCLPEDVFNALRDSYDGFSTSNHCRLSFSNMIALKAHINKHVYLRFDRLQAMVTPIVARPDVCMRLRHRSVIGFMLDRGIYSELATRCAFCHIQVHAKAMSRHYRDSHPDLLRHAQMHQDFIHGLANFESGRGECPRCRIKIPNVQKHQCCVVYQLAAMTGHIFQPENFPTMPCMKRPWYRSGGPGNDLPPDEAPTPAPQKPRHTAE